ncbi:hypothetical protein VRU48_12345 [Pedobacter sp. KR3-3]|uniref:PH domain-containing protein n=1 Tax=Pedobacter albus TaxID=3113905 RepID=A0ABU7I8U8_9SPHI|nr:hypothetical protein [Pedobacter sp. KR3-3]MEE1945902.1 hypothetical protein [Pedobacter sp. KR3-3]
MEIYRMTVANHIKNGWLIIFGTIICLNLHRIFLLIDSSQSYHDSAIASAVCFFLFVLPAIVLHLNYFLVNMGVVLKYSPGEKKMEICKRGFSIVFFIEDIEYVEQSISFNEAEHRAPVLTWDKYNHSVIHLKNGKVFTITSLLVPDFKPPIEKEKLKIKKNMFRLASMNKNYSN